jgi:hypothetical protein
LGGILNELGLVEHRNIFQIFLGFFQGFEDKTRTKIMYKMMKILLME